MMIEYIFIVILVNNLILLCIIIHYRIRLKSLKEINEILEGIIEKKDESIEIQNNSIKIQNETIEIQKRRQEKLTQFPTRYGHSGKDNLN